MSAEPSKPKKEPLDANAESVAAEEPTKKKKKSKSGAANAATAGDEEEAAQPSDDAAASAAQFAEVKRVYNEFAPKLQEWGLPIDELNNKLMQVRHKDARCCRLVAARPDSAVCCTRR